MKQPQAFLSYTRFDNKHDRGQITELGKSLSEEVHALTGVEFPIFQDERDIEIGLKWKEQLDKSLNSVVFLIPVVTPSYFQSIFCLDELEYFITHEERLNRRDLILPVYYIDCPNLSSKADQRQIRCFKEIFSRQYFDWRPWRRESRIPIKAVRDLARSVVKALSRADLPPSSPAEPGKRKHKRAMLPLRTSDLLIKQIVMTVTINSYGDGDYRYKYSGVSCKPGKAISEAILTRHTSWGQFGRFSVLSKNLTNISVHTEKKLVNSDESTEAVTKVRFGEPLTEATGSINFELQMWLYGAFAADKLEQSQRKNTLVEGMGWISFTVDNPTEELRIVLQRDTMEFSKDKVDVAIFDESGKRHKELESKFPPFVEIHLLRWQIKAPQVGFRYELQWKLPEIPSSHFSESQTLYPPEDIRKILIRAAGSQWPSFFLDWVQQSARSYLQRFSDTQEEDIDISLHVLDDENYRLKLVAGLFTDDRPVWRWSGFKPGTGLVGRAYKCNRVAFFSTLRSGADADAYIDPDDPLFSDIQLERYEVLLSCPVHWNTGRSRQDIIALINIGSHSRNSKLHHYVPGREFDEWLKEISKSALRHVVTLIASRLESELTES